MTDEIFFNPPMSFPELYWQYSSLADRVLESKSRIDRSDMSKEDKLKAHALADSLLARSAQSQITTKKLALLINKVDVEDEEWVQVKRESLSDPIVFKLKTVKDDEVKTNEKRQEFHTTIQYDKALQEWRLMKIRQRKIQDE